MTAMRWHDEVLDVRRLVLRTTAWAEYRQTLIPLAARYGLTVADDRAAPRPGDLWLGCQPLGGWAGACPVAVGRVAADEIPAAVLALMAGQYGYLNPVTTRTACRPELVVA